MEFLEFSGPRIFLSWNVLSGNFLSRDFVSRKILAFISSFGCPLFNTTRRGGPSSFFLFHVFPLEWNAKTKRDIFQRYIWRYWMCCCSFAEKVVCSKNLLTYMLVFGFGQKTLPSRDGCIDHCNVGFPCYYDQRRWSSMIYFFYLCPPLWDMVANVRGIHALR